MKKGGNHLNDVVMLTTIDNPYNPITHWDEWLAYDLSHGYNTCGYLSRIASTTDEMSDADQTEAIISAIDEICRLNINGMYKKVSASIDKKA